MGPENGGECFQERGWGLGVQFGSRVLAQHTQGPALHHQHYQKLSNKRERTSTVVHTYNLSYSRSGDGRIEIRDQSGQKISKTSSQQMS
jgi:hypothetical protein